MSHPQGFTGTKVHTPNTLMQEEKMPVLKYLKYENSVILTDRHKITILLTVQLYTTDQFQARVRV